MKDERVSVRFKAHTVMLLMEMSERTGSSMSVIIRMFVEKGIDRLLDDEGNLQLKIDERSQGKGCGPENDDAPV